MLTISEVADLAGVTVRAVRHYRHTPWRRVLELIEERGWTGWSDVRRTGS